ncbi:MAG: hypothetical protein P9M07_04080 [Candidatus Aceula meridiana]|nr:hypothetical protein [Candidatus Aceula meridiana]
MFQKNIKRALIVVFIFLCVGRFAFAQELPLKESQENLSPRCSSSQDCKQPGMLGVCQFPGEKTSKCFYREIIDIPVIVILPDNCRSCQTGLALRDLQMMLPGLRAEYIKNSDPRAKELIKKFGISMLPAYVLSKEAEREEIFADLAETVEYKDGEYYLKPEHSGVSFFLSRKFKKKNLDLFLILLRPGMFHAVKLAKDLKKKDKDIKLNIHFVAMKAPETGVLISPEGAREVEEDTLYACIEKQYPKKALDYLSCRLADVKSLWWEDCAKKNGVDVQRIKKCARSREGQKLFEQKIKISDELKVRYAPLFLMENVEIFGISESTDAQEILNVLESKTNK